MMFRCLTKCKCKILLGTCDSHVFRNRKPDEKNRTVNMLSTILQRAYLIRRLIVHSF